MSSSALARSAPDARRSSKPKIQRAADPTARPRNTERNAPGRVIEERSTPRKRIVHSPIQDQRTVFMFCISPAVVKRAHRTTRTRLMPIAVEVESAWTTTAFATRRGAVISGGRREAPNRAAQPRRAATTPAPTERRIAPRRRLRARAMTIAMGATRTTLPSTSVIGRSSTSRTKRKRSTSSVTPCVVAFANTPIVQVAAIARIERRTSRRSSRRRCRGAGRSAKRISRTMRGREGGSDSGARADPAGASGVPAEARDSASGPSGSRAPPSATSRGSGASGDEGGSASSDPSRPSAGAAAAPACDCAARLSMGPILPARPLRVVWRRSMRRHEEIR